MRVPKNNTSPLVVYSCIDPSSSRIPILKHHAQCRQVVHPRISPSPLHAFPHTMHSAGGPSSPVLQVTSLSVESGSLPFGGWGAFPEPLPPVSIEVKLPDVIDRMFEPNRESLTCSEVWMCEQIDSLT